MSCGRRGPVNVLSYLVRIFVFAIFLALCFYAYSEGQADILEDRANLLFSNMNIDNTGPQTIESGTALTVLKQNCGSCHQSTLKTAKPKALEIFDLDKESWHETVKDKHLEGIASRIGKSKGLSEADRKATLDFIGCVSRADKSGFPTIC